MSLHGAEACLDADVLLLKTMEVSSTVAGCGKAYHFAWADVVDVLAWRALTHLHQDKQPFIILPCTWHVLGVSLVHLDKFLKRNSTLTRRQTQAFVGFSISGLEVRTCSHLRPPGSLASAE